MDDDAREASERAKEDKVSLNIGGSENISSPELTAWKMLPWNNSTVVDAEEDIYDSYGDNYADFKFSLTRDDDIKILIPLVICAGVVIFFICRKCVCEKSRESSAVQMTAFRAFRDSTEHLPALEPDIIQIITSAGTGIVSRTDSIRSNTIGSGNNRGPLIRAVPARSYTNSQGNLVDHIPLINIRVHLHVSTNRNDPGINLSGRTIGNLRNTDMSRTSDVILHRVSPTVCESSLDDPPTYNAVVSSDLSEQGTKFPMVTPLKTLESPPPSYEDQQTHKSNG